MRTKVFCMFEIHEFMDLEPRTQMYVFRDEEEAKAFERQMNSDYSGGTTTFVKALTKEEAMQYVIDTIENTIEHPWDKREDGLLSVDDKEFINTLIKRFKEAYK